MSTNIGLRLCFLVCASIFSITAARAQQTPAAPVPPTLRSGKHVFISNAGADSGLFPHPFTGTPDRVYNQFYAAAQGLGRFNLVSLPSEADLVFELQLLAPYGPSDPNKRNGASDPLPMFRLVIIDARTHYILWTLTQTIKPATGQTNHDRTFDEALAALVLNLKTLTAKSPT